MTADGASPTDEPPTSAGDPASADATPTARETTAGRAPSLAARAPIPSVTLPLVALAVGVGAWWAAVILFDIPAYLLPAPDAVVARLAARPGLYLRNALVTLRTVAVGGLVGAGFGFVAAVAVVHSTVLRRAVYPYLVAARVLPKIAIAPVLLVFLGTGRETAVTFVALVAFFPTFVDAAAGLDETPERYLDLLESVDAGPVRTFAFVRIPAALPAVFAGLKQSAALAVVGAVVAEWILTDEGLGFLVLIGAENVQPAAVLAAVLVLFAEGFLAYGLVALVQRRVDWR